MQLAALGKINNYLLSITTGIKRLKPSVLAKPTLLIALSFLGHPAFPATLGDQAPQFSLPQLNNGHIVELTDYRGKVIYLDFWASWCPPCRVSIPEIESMQKTLSNEDFEVLAINLDKDKHAARQFLKRFPVSYTVLSDINGKVAKDYALPGMPTSYVVSKNGEVTMVHKGFKSGDMAKISAHIKRLLHENK